MKNKLCRFFILKYASLFCCCLQNLWTSVFHSLLLLGCHLTWSKLVFSAIIIDHEQTTKSCIPLFQREFLPF